MFKRKILYVNILYIIFHYVHSPFLFYFPLFLLLRTPSFILFFKLNTYFWDFTLNILCFPKKEISNCNTVYLKVTCTRPFILSVSPPRVYFKVRFRLLFFYFITLEKNLDFFLLSFLLVCVRR